MLRFAQHDSAIFSQLPSTVSSTSRFYLGKLTKTPFAWNAKDALSSPLRRPAGTASRPTAVCFVGHGSGAHLQLSVAQRVLLKKGITKF